MREPNSLTIGGIWRGLLDLLFPPRCIGCQELGTWLCDSCRDQAPLVSPPYCERCGDRVSGGQVLCRRCQTAPLQIRRIRSVTAFQGVPRAAMHRLKYRGQTALAAPLGELMANYWKENGDPVDVITPVPLHKVRLRERGYNQAALLARETALRLKVPLAEHALERHRATRSQVDLSADERRANVREAFRCTGDAVSGKRVLLIDDVCTTGATLEACAIALEQGAARDVQALTLARAC